MSQKVVDIPGIGEVLLSKRRGSKNLRISLLPDGRVRVGMPNWVPYAAGVKFALSRSEWINAHQPNGRSTMLKNGDLIGKSCRLVLVHDPYAKTFSSRLSQNQLIIKSHMPLSNKDIQKKIQTAGERALKNEASHLLKQRINHISSFHSIEYKRLRIKKLSSRWGSCSNDKTITLSYFLIQLPWHLIDYVIIHELAHLTHLNHSPDFWSHVENMLPEAKKFRKEIKTYRPVLMSV
jgi:predicted metal-dependent hydrolase